jgi:hypothetical protein
VEKKDAAIAAGFSRFLKDAFRFRKLLLFPAIYYNTA